MQPRPSLQLPIFDASYILTVEAKYLRTIQGLRECGVLIL
jgi:hypothetical protein